MKKVSVPVTNDICPQTLFVYGTKNEDGTPDFGLFCWFSYCWFDQLGVICAIGGSKRTLENIRRNKVFSADLVVESNLPLADYFGTADGRDADKMDVTVEWEEGAVLPVPVLCSSPLTFELEVDKEITTGKQDEVVLLCRIRNVLKDEALLDTSLTPEEIYKKVAAVCTSVDCNYWSWDGRHLGTWHERAKEIKADVEIGAAAQGN
ncbi:MAG: flavin reductase [Lachnospiraceae bacterium]|nr:flavin reductase [Lachnospiraceae bacterium]MBQ8547195.1 flavin reductase [Lachnospiraceae bacterium]